MPGRDGTGPFWARGNWNCRRREVAPGCGYGYGFSRNLSKSEEKQMLVSRIEFLKSEIEQLNKRKAEIKE
ncbi:MAG: DUF5320 domain-containing protein [Candidatus ainarchaeum sp.]|nr:DUF5320 domain-containing protein [Candidatus ainarchaeum sp.]